MSPLAARQAQYAEDAEANLAADVERVSDVICQMLAKLGPAMRDLGSHENWPRDAAKMAADRLDYIGETLCELVSESLPNEVRFAREWGFDLHATVGAFAKAEADKLTGGK